MSSYPQLEIKLIDGNRNRKTGHGRDEKTLRLGSATKPDGGAILRLMQRVTEKLIADVPSTHAVCEFDCRKVQCSHTDWTCCARRLAHADGELWPALTGAADSRTRVVG